MTSTDANNDWRKILQNLEGIFSNSETKLAILRKIDRSYFAKDREFSTVLLEVCEEVSQTRGVTGTCVGIEVEGNFVEIVGDNKNLLDSLNGMLAMIAKLSPNNLVELERKLNGKNIYGLKIPHIYKSNLIFAFSLDVGVADRDDFTAFVDYNFFEQIKVLSSAFSEREIRLAENSAYQAFFSSRLRPSASWKQLLSAVESYLPSWAMPDKPDQLLKQLLIYNEGDEFLKIAAGRNEETGHFILADRSICGRLIKNRNKDFLLLNPAEEDDYLGYGDTKSRTELAIRLSFEGKTVGVLNLEHPNIDAFNIAFQEGAKRACEFLSPIVGAMSARYESNKNKERALLYVFTDMLSRMGDTYGHLVSQPLFTSRNSISEIRYLVEQAEISKVDLFQELGKLERAIDEFQNHSDDFTKGLPEFVSYGSQTVGLTIAKRLEKFAKLASSEGIKLQIEENPKGLEAFASSLLQEHIFNIVNNSFQQIRKRIFTGEQATGNILVKISKKQGASKLKDATGLNYVLVVIQDDGGGAEENTIASIGQFGFTTKQEHGTGYGVAAAREYFQSIGGHMTYDNFGPGFRTDIVLQEFNGAVHTDSSMIGLE